MELLRPNAITATLLMLMTAFGITLAGMKFLKVKPIPSRWKATTPSCDTTWLVWLDPLVVSRDVPLRSSVHCVYSFIVLITASSTSIATLSIPPMSWNSLTQQFSHSHQTVPVKASVRVLSQLSLLISSRLSTASGAHGKDPSTSFPSGEPKACHPGADTRTTHRILDRENGRMSNRAPSDASGHISRRQ